MPKKFFDIIPPKKLTSLSEKPEAQKFEEVFEEKKKTRRSKKNLPKILFISSIFLVLFVIFVYSFFSKIEIEIWPVMETVTFQETITIDTKADFLDVESKVIPGRIFESEKTGAQEFSSSGEILKEVKASGVVRVYNAFATASQPLLASTRFVSADGKLFRSLKREVISGGSYEKGKLVAGYTDIEVAAAEPGEEYNIGPAVFSIPGFAGTPKYTAFYGKSFDSMTGGFKGEVAIVTKEDIEKAENILAERLKQESKNSLQNLLPEEFILLNETISQEIKENICSVESDSEAESFDLQVKIQSKGLGFNGREMDNFVKENIFLNISEDKRIKEDSLQIDYSLKDIDIEEGMAVLELTAKAKVYSDVDLIQFKKAIFGKTINEVKMFLENFPRIERIAVKSWPFWRRRIPESMEKVNIELKVD